MRKTFAFNRIMAFALVMVMVIIMVPTHFFPQAADDDTPRTSNMFIRSGDVSVEGNLQRGTTLAASKVADPFTSAVLRSSTKSLNGVIHSGASVNGITPAPVSDEPEILTYSQLNYLGFYDISLRKGGADVQPDGQVKVTINNIDLSGVKNAKVIHILDSEEAIRDAQKRGTAIWVNDTRFVKSFSDEAKVAKKATGVDGVVIIEEISIDSEKGNSISFTTGSFSIFAVVDDDDDTRLKVNFIATKFNTNGQANGTSTVATIVIKKTDLSKILNADQDGEYIDYLVYDPGVNGLLPDDVLFRGWSQNENYTVADASNNAMTIAAVRAAIKERLNSGVGDDLPESMDFYAMLYRQFSVTYFDQAGVVCLGRDYVLQRADNAAAEIDYQITLNYVPYGQFQNFEGWKLKAGDKSATGDQFYTNAKQNLVGIYPNGIAGTLVTDSIDGINVHDYIYKTPTWIRISGDIYLQAESPDGHWLVFDENGKGATYVAPQFVKTEEVTVDPLEDENSGVIEMQRFGYRFGGWFDTKEHADAHSADITVTTGEYTFGQHLTDNVTIYASWIPNLTANYSVIIWRQDVSGTGYDFAESVTLTGSVGSEISSVSSFGSGNNAYVTVNGAAKRYTGFHLKEFDENVEIVPEGTAILNVYYDRNEVTLHFRVYNTTGGIYSETTAVSGTLYGQINTGYVRIYSDDNGQTWYYYNSGSYLENPSGIEPAFGFVNGQYVQLVKVNNNWYYLDNTQYGQNTIGEERYGLVNNQYVQLTMRNGQYQYVSGSHFEYRQNDSNNGTRYGLVNGQYVEIFYTSGGGCGGNGGWGYYTYNPTNSTTGNNDYYGIVNGEYVQLERSGNTFYYNGQRYTGQRYTRQENEYTGTRYERYEVEDWSVYSGDYYTHYIQYSDDLYKEATVNYTGKRYVYSGSEGWNEIHTYSGLYGQTLESQGYSWPTEYWWYDSFTGRIPYTGDGTRTTFLDAFILSSGDSEETYYGFEGTGNNPIRFYKWDGINTDFDLNNPTNTVNINVGNGVTFYISDKYNGYRAYQYSTDGRNWINLPATPPGNDGYYASVSNFTNLYIRFIPRQYNIIFMDGQYVDGNNNPVIGYSSRGKLGEVDGINYDSSLSSYNKGGADYFEPTFNGFVFEGWYLDDACTHPYTFTTMSEGIKVYAKWRQIQYRVFLHPNAGTDSSLNWGSETQAMSFRVANGGTISVPTGTRDDYLFAGWYLDPELTQSFIPATVLNEQTVTVAYNKAEDMTDIMDKWGFVSGGDVTDPVTGEVTHYDAPYNSDLVGYNGGDRFWITKKLDLYAKWRRKIVGADGMYIKFVTKDDEGRVGHFSDGTANTNDALTEYCDGDLYTDGAFAYGLAACDAPTTDLHFRYWVVQQWNASANNGQGGFVDSTTIVYPGQRFETIYQYAQAIPVPTTDPDYNEQHNKFKYYMVLRAEYSEVVPLTTNLIFDANNGTFDTTKTYASLTSVIDDTTTYTPAVTAATVTYSDVPINQHFNLVPSENISREGYKFLGWAYTANATEPVWAPDFSDMLAVDDLDRSSSETGNDTTNTLYAVWEINRYNVDVVKKLDNKGVDDGWLTHEYTFNYTIVYPDGFNPTADDTGSGSVTATVSPVVGSSVLEGTATIEGIPHGSKLTVTEKTNDVVNGDALSAVFDITYAVGETTGTSVIDPVVAENNGDTAGTITVTNVRKTFTVTVKKVVSAEPGFPTTVTFPFESTGLGTDNATFELVNDETKTITDIPYGTMISVTELPDGYDNKYYVGTRVVTGATDAATMKVTNNIDIVYTNKIKYYDVTVTKNVESDFTPDKTRAYSFTVTLVDGTEYTFDLTNGKNNTTIDTPVPLHFVYGTKFKLEETAVDNMTVTITPAADSEGYYTVTDNMTITVKNTRENVTVTVNKTVDGSDTDKTANFNFNAVAVIGNDSAAVTGTGVDANGNFTLNGSTNNTITLTVPKGAILTVSETANDSYNTYLNGRTTKATAENGKYTYSTSALTADGTVINFRNVKLVTISFVKEIVNYGSTSTAIPAWTSFTVNYEQADLAQTVEVPADGTAATVTVEYGTALSDIAEDLTKAAPNNNSIKVGDVYDVTIDVTSVDGKSDAVVTITNTLKLFTVTVRKFVDNLGINDGLDTKSFSFQYTINSAGSYNVTNASFTLNKYAAASGNTPAVEQVITVPYGASFALEEVDAENFGGTTFNLFDLFTVQYADSEGVLGDDCGIGTVHTDTIANVYNTRNTRKVRIEKTVISPFADDLHAYVFNWTTDKAFDLNPDDQTAATNSGSVTLTPTANGVTVKETITIPAGLKITVTEDAVTNPDLFVGVETTVQVAELNADGTEPASKKVKGYVGEITLGSKDVVIRFENTRITKDLTIVKTYDENVAGNTPDLTGRTFIFRITSDYGYDRTVMIKGAGSVTIKQLRAGYTYTVTEITGWSYEFDAKSAKFKSSAEGAVEIVSNAKDSVSFMFEESGTATFMNEKNSTNWLRGEAYAKNTFTRITSEQR